MAPEDQIGERWGAGAFPRGVEDAPLLLTSVARIKRDRWFVCLVAGMYMPRRLSSLLYLGYILCACRGMKAWWMGPLPKLL